MMSEVIEMPDSPPRHVQRPEADLGTIDITDSEPEDDRYAGGNPSWSQGKTSGQDVYSIYLSQVLEIIPDVLPEHALKLIRSCNSAPGNGVLETVMHALFEDSSYPKVENGKGKRKRQDDETNNAEKLRKIDYGNKDRLREDGPNYRILALEQLYSDFPYIPVPYVRQKLAQNNGLYAPTYLFLAAEQRSGKPSYKLKSIPSRVNDKGKGLARLDEQFQEERAWLLQKLQEAPENEATAVVEQLKEKEYEDCEDGIECGCCFTLYPFDKMVQCPDAHLFCTECMTSYAETLLGGHNHHIICMDQSGCKLPFTYSEIRRFLSSKLLELYERVKQAKEIEMAGLEGLEACPHCEFKIVMENPDERLFRCQNRECEAVTCRKCKKADHLPKSCEEVEQDKKLDARHYVEEAMTRALMRNCPKCNKAFVKEHGCNKMTCPNCQTLSCYTCRKVITGYDHFKDPGNRLSSNRSGCALYDPATEQRHNDEVAAAAKKAIEDLKRDRPEVDAKDLQFDLSKASTAGPSNPPLQHPPYPPEEYRQQVAAAFFAHEGRGLPGMMAMQNHLRNLMPQLPHGGNHGHMAGGVDIPLQPQPVHYNFNLNFAPPNPHHIGYPLQHQLEHQPQLPFAYQLPPLPQLPVPQRLPQLQPPQLQLPRRVVRRARTRARVRRR